MALAFVGGTMNLTWMGGAMVLMALEKLPSIGRTISAPLGVALILAAVVVAGSSLAAYIDDRASDAAFEKLIDIFSGNARGTTGLFSVLVGTFLGAERAPVTFESDGQRRRLTVPKKIVGEVEPIEGAAPGEEVKVVNTQYWMGSDITVAKATESRVRAFGRVWDFTGRSAEICQIAWAGP